MQAKKEVKRSEPQRERRSVEGLTKGRKKETRMCLQKSRPAPSFEGGEKRKRKKRERERVESITVEPVEVRTVRSDHPLASI